jgi:cation transport protein ChaC
MDADLWVFGYGSLMWDTGFPVIERQVARLTGWQRSFCMWSVHYRGTADDPGLVLALDRDDAAYCDGIAFRVAANDQKAALVTLRDRELISYAYRETVLPINLRDGRTVSALTYVINQDHAQYGGGLPLEEQARILATRQGIRGPNSDYLWNTVDHLTALGLSDPDLDWLARRVREISA